MTDLLAEPTLRAGNQSGTARRLGTMAGMAAIPGAVADVATTGGIGTGIAAGTAGLNAAAQAASRRAPFLMGDLANQGGLPSSLLSNPGQLLDEMLYPFVGSDDERVQP